MEFQIKSRRIAQGIRAFLFLTILGAAVVFYFSGTKGTLLALQKIQLRYLLLASGLIGIDLTSSAGRIHVFVRKIKPQKSFLTCLKAYLANVFLAAATPFQTGGGIAQLYIMNRNGISYAAGLPISLLNFAATLTVLFIGGFAVFTFAPKSMLGNHPLFAAVDFSRVIFYFALALFLFFVLWPKIFGQSLQSLLSWLARRFRSQRTSLLNLRAKIPPFIQSYQDYWLDYWHHGKLSLLLNFIFTIIIYFNKCLVAYVIFRGLGVKPNFWEVVMLQMLIVFFLYFAPTPGGSLIAETGTSVVMSLIVPAYLTSLFAVLWRFFTTYVGVILGGIVLLRAIGQPYPLPQPAAKDGAAEDVCQA